MPTWLQGWEGKDAVSVVIAGFALIFSIYSALYARNNKSREDNRSIKSQLNEIILKIIETQSQSNKDYQDAQKNNTVEHWQLQSAAVSQKLIALARLAIYLDSQSKSPASDIEYATIAGSLASAGDPTAETYWKKAIERAPNHLYEIFNRRGYADYLFTLGRQKDGRDMYVTGLNILKEDTDTVKYTDGYTHRMWGISEQNWGYSAEAQTQFSKAEERFSQLQRAHMRDFALRDLNYVRNIQGVDVHAEIYRQSDSIEELRDVRNSH